MDKSGSPQFEKLTERFHTIDGLRTFSTVLGAGPDVVLVHGAGVSSRYWRKAQRHLAALGPYRVHALDFPGFGRSENAPWPPELARLARHLEAWLDAVEVVPCALVGQSVGCEISVLTAAARPEQVAKLVLAAPSGLPELESLAGQLFAAALDAPREPLETFRTVLPDYWRCGPIRLLRVLAEQLRCPAERYLPNIAQPTLVLRGERDTVVPLERMQTVAAMIPGALTATVPGAHGAHITHPAEFAQTVGGFLKTSPGGWCRDPARTPGLPAAAPARNPGAL